MIGGAAVALHAVGLAFQPAPVVVPPVVELVIPFEVVGRLSQLDMAGSVVAVDVTGDLVITALSGSLDHAELIGELARIDMTRGA